MYLSLCGAYMTRTGHIYANSSFVLLVDSINARKRIDKYLSEQFPLYSRSFFQKIIDDGFVAVNDHIVDKSSIKLKEKDVIAIRFPGVHTVDSEEVLKQELGVEIVHSDEQFMIINKPAGLIVHKASTHSTDITLVDWLLARYKEIAKVGYVDRPGIVHRLDKDTSGILIIPRTNYAHSIFSDLFKNRNIKKMYYAIVQGHPDTKGTIDFAIGRHPTKKVCMKTFDHADPEHHIRAAKTDYEVLEYYDDSALLKVFPVTGRTHQIRVHLAAIGYPIIGDKLYGKVSKYIDRHALHAAQISFLFNDKMRTFQCDMPDDMKRLRKQLKSA